MFDYKKFSSLLKKSTFNDKKLTSDSLHQELDNRGFEIGVETIKSYRKGNIKNPPIDILNEIANIANCSIQDFFSDADKKREQITREEISKDPKKYINYILSSLKDIDYSDENIDLLKDALAK